MRAIKIFLGYILLFTVIGCSSKYGIYKSYAFSRKMTAGNIPVDQNGKSLTSGVQKAHLVYLETKAELPAPAWDTAWINGDAYLIEPIKLSPDKIMLGKTKDETMEIILQPEQGNILWQLMLNPLKPVFYNETKGNSNPIILSGPWKNKRVSYKIKEQTELATIYGQ